MEHKKPLRKRAQGIETEEALEMKAQKTKGANTFYSKQVKSKTGSYVVALLGPAFSFTDLAFRTPLKNVSFDHPAAAGRGISLWRGRRLRMTFFRVVYYSTIQAVFQAVLSGKADFGFLPLKNSTTGFISETKKQLRRNRKKITVFHTVSKKISHYLGCLKKSRLGNITTIMAPKIIFQQCKKFLKHLPKTRKYTHTSSEACALLAKKHWKYIAVIASEEAIAHYGLKIICRHIEDKPHNSTSFILLKKIQ